MPLKEAIYQYDDAQKIYCSKIKNFYKAKNSLQNPKAFIKTYGCQQNVSDSENYAGMLFEMGFDITDDKFLADVIVLNTCAIRENAENKVFGNLGQIKNLKKTKRNLFVVLCGCMTEQESVLQKICNTYSFVNLIMGTHSKGKFPELFYKALIQQNAKHKSVIINEKQDIITEGIPCVKSRRLKAFVSIMYGCNNYCSYCIVPYVRGRERSRKPSDIINEFKKLLAAGYKDITLLGQNVNSYGRGLKEETSFPELLKVLDSFDGEYKIRFMTSHPKDASKKLFDVMAKSRHISHHIHLPVQCGNNRVLSEMNRKYTKEDYLEIISYAKKVIPDILFTSDIIVGFPGETYEEFCETKELIKKVKFLSLFTFIYSPRNGTPAAKMRDNISKEEKTKWLMELLDEQEKISEKLCKDMVGKKTKVLAEDYLQNSGELICRIDGNIIVKAKGSAESVGNFLNIQITNAFRESLAGEII